VAERKQLRAPREVPRHVIDAQTSLDVDIGHLDGRTGAASGSCPGQQVGVVFADGEHDLVACRQVRRAPRRGGKVDGLGRATGEDHFERIGGVQKVRNRLTRGRETLGGASRAGVHGRGVGVVFLVEPHDGVDDRLCAVRRCGAIEVDGAGIRGGERGEEPAPCARSRDLRRERLGDCACRQRGYAGGHARARAHERAALRVHAAPRVDRLA
jgi:hypothetical protein